MRLAKTVIAIMGASMLLVGTVATPALADTDLSVYGGNTKITTSGETLTELLHHGVVMSAAEGAKSVRVRHEGVVRQRFTFGITTPSNLMLEDDPVTGKVGSVTGGRYQHLGAIKFLKTQTAKSLKLGGFGLNFTYMTVFATELNGDPVDPVAVFQVHVVDPPLYPVYDSKSNPTTATVSELRLTLTQDAADLLNNELNARVFEGGMKFGHVVSVAQLVK